MSKIFVRERREIGPGAGMPRYAIVAASGTDLRVYARHIRKAELEKLASEISAEIVYLPRGEHAEEEEQGRRGGGHGRGRRMGGRGAMDQE